MLANADSTTIVSLIAGDTVRVSSATTGFYRGRKWRPAWITGDDLSGTGEKMLEVLGRSEDDGLNPLRYRYDVLQKMVTALKSGGGEAGLDETVEAQYAADVDVLLTEAFTRYANDLARGTLDPAAGGLKWQIPRGNAPKSNILRALVKKSDPAEIIQRIRPSAPQYARLSNVLGRMNEVRTRGGWPTVSAADIKKGDSSANVAVLRSRLAMSEDPREAAMAQRGTERPEVFDHDLFLALKYFQQRHALDDDGRIDTKTLEELNHTIDERVAEIKLNLDRWRWLPHDLGRMYVMVNVAGFEMEVVEGNRVIEAMNVVVGQEGWETPIFADTLEHLVVNPYWNVPPSILSEELGNLAKDPAYLARNNFEWTKDGNLRQRPGPKNALGEFKFQFPNKDNIYMHDTPADALFSRTSRAFSHGCIRLERPRDLAYLLGGKLAGKSARQIDKLVETGSEQWVPFRKKIPIYILYFTTWIDDDGTVRFHHDVYRQNESLEDQTKKFDARIT